METKNNNIKSVSKAIKIIEVIVKHNHGISLSQLANELGMARSTVHGLVSTLLDNGYVAQDNNTGYYELGNKLYEVGNAVANKWTEKKIAREYINYLGEKFKETVHMSKLSEGQVLYIDKYESTQSIRIETEIGVLLPAYCTGVGKVLMAYLSLNEVQFIMKKHPLIKYTDNTITNLDKLRSELNKIKEHGYAIDNQEYMIGLYCIAVPIFNHHNEVIAALSISAHISRINEQYTNKIINELLKVSKEISLKLGSTYYE
ncbi:MAG: IclR family transcriptional regulator [Bacilli bacterium]|jgi:DNA-binding IclR family transcriptional regulator|nr:IclR family transcriptional regulator [Bacilli bacterium]